MRILGRIVGVRSTEQSVGIKVGGFCPDIYLRFNEEKKKVCTFEYFRNIIPSLTVGKIKMATNPVNMGSVAVFYFVTICAIL